MHTWTWKQLKARLKARSLPATGKKQALVMRLLNTDDKGLAPSPKEMTKTIARETQQSVEMPDELKAFGAVAQPKSRMLKSLDAAIEECKKP